MLSTIAACGTLKKEIGLRRDSEAFLLWTFPTIPSLPTVPSTDGSFVELNSGSLCKLPLEWQQISLRIMPQPSPVSLQYGEIEETEFILELILLNYLVE